MVLQATVCDCLALDPFAFEEDGLSAPEVDVSWGKIVEDLVIAGMVVTALITAARAALNPAWVQRDPRPLRWL